VAIDATVFGMRILVLGGYGTFGGRLVRLLADRPGLTMLVAGRSGAKAQSYCSRIASAGKLMALPFDRDGDVVSQLRNAALDMVVDASGPFQAYGDDPYRLVKACLALNIDYIDLADGSCLSLASRVLMTKRSGADSSFCPGSAACPS
jgi:short subunit dehydrogenase-like uncharacterized protein